MSKSVYTQYKKWYNYFRYHHYNSHPLRDSHDTYITALSYIEVVGDFEVNDVDESWKLILSTLKMLNYSDYKTLDRIVKK